MTPRPTTHWERERSAWYRDAARSEIREGASPLLWMLGFGAVGLVADGMQHLDELRGPGALLAGLGCALTLWGLMRGRAWARWSGAAVAAALLLFQAVALAGALLGDAPVDLWRVLVAVSFAGVTGAILWSLVEPGARERFTRARRGVDESAPPV
ncbi:MAG: hypothetical protein H6828_10875 [Planctomycetes bacterium]|nr:hypothetical protein [Planctomycetota bacterium]